MTKYNTYLYDVFGNRINDDFRDLVNDILDRIDFDEYLDNRDDFYELLIEDIDQSYFIYGEYQWAMMMQYQSPQDANFNEAFDLFVGDMLTLIDSIINDMASEE